MATESEVTHIAELADVGIEREELGTFTHSSMQYLNTLDVLDRVSGDTAPVSDLWNVMRDDETEPSLPQEEVLRNAAATEDGFIKAPRVM